MEKEASASLFFFASSATRSADHRAGFVTAAFLLPSAHLFFGKAR
jgi:hypothetical protein